MCVWLAVLFAAAAALMGSCTAETLPPPTVEADPSISQLGSLAPTAIETVPEAEHIQSTSVMVADDDIPELQTNETAATPAPDPLKIAFPDAQLAPISAWRPPLYPTPWALSPNDHFYFARPIAADEVNWPLWDYRYGGIFFEDTIHTGIDITAPMYTPVIAAGSGEIVWAGYGLYSGYYNVDDPYGLAVQIHHDFGYAGRELYTVYGHLDRIDVTRGQHVDVGQSLGVSGQTGFVTGPHLHFEVRLGESDFFDTYNPELWLVPPEGWGVLVGQVMDSRGWLKPIQDVYIKNLDTNHEWLAKSYGGGTVNSDPYYQENFVIGDLPAGRYEIKIPFYGIYYIQEVRINPGAITYFTFEGRYGFTMQDPPVPEFSPD